MRVGAIPLVAAILGGLLASSANAQSVGYGLGYKGHSMQVKYVQVAEMFCAAGATCTFPVTTQMESGLSRAEVFLTGWYAEFLPANTTYDTNRVHIEVKRNQYNSTTGELTWDVSATLSDFSGLATGFNFGVYATIILSDQVSARLHRHTFYCAGETDAACSGFTGLSFGTSTVPFQMMAVRGFDLRTSGGQSMNLQQLIVDTTGFLAAGTTVSGIPTCGILGDTVQDMECTLELVPIAWNPSHATFSLLPPWNMSSDQRVFQYGFSPRPSWAQEGFFLGLQSFDLSFMTHPSSTLRHSAGCFAPRYPSVWGEPFEREWQWIGHLSDSPNWVHGEFIVSNECALVDLY